MEPTRKHTPQDQSRLSPVSCPVHTTRHPGPHWGAGSPAGPQVQGLLSRAGGQGLRVMPDPHSAWTRGREALLLQMALDPPAVGPPPRAKLSPRLVGSTRGVGFPRGTACSLPTRALREPPVRELSGSSSELRK